MFGRRRSSGAASGTCRPEVVNVPGVLMPFMKRLQCGRSYLYVVRTDAEAPVIWPSHMVLILYLERKHSAIAPMLDPALPVGATAYHIHE